MLDRSKDVGSVSRSLTLTPMLPTSKSFTNSPVAEEFFAKLKASLGLVVVAGYLSKNGTGPYEILHLYADKEESTPNWWEKMTSEPLESSEYTAVRNILFEVFEKYALKLPLEKAYDEKTGALLSDNCFYISLIDFDYWQEYWKNGDDRLK